MLSADYRASYPRGMQITLDDSQLKEFRRDLKAFTKRAYPIAMQRSVNRMATNTQRIAKKTVARKMIIRNQWTQRGIQTQWTKTLDPRKMQSHVGARQLYLERQEFGAMQAPKPIPSRSASGEGRGHTSRRRAVKRLNMMKNLQVERANLSRNPKTRAQKDLILIITAARRGGGLVLLRSRKGDLGVYRVTGRRVSRKRIRSNRAGQNKSGAIVKNVELLWNFSEDAIRTPVNPWLKPSVDKAITFGPAVLKKEMKKQMQRHRLFTGR